MFEETHFYFPTLTAHCHYHFHILSSRQTAVTAQHLSITNSVFTGRFNHLSAGSIISLLAQFYFFQGQSCQMLSLLTFQLAAHLCRRQGSSFFFSPFLILSTCQVKQHDVSFLTSVSEKIYFEATSNFIILHSAYSSESICAAMTLHWINHTPKKNIPRKERNHSSAMMLITHWPFCC